MTLTASKQKKCKAPGCGREFTAFRTTQKVCGPKCAAALVDEQKAKQEAREKREQKKRNRAALEKLKSKKTLVAEAQKEFNRWVRERDHGRPCISCGGFHDSSKTLTGGGMQAGHFRTVKAHPELRFEPMNCHSQCPHCNNHLSGNQLAYQERLREVIGQEALDWLLGPHKPKRYREDDLRQIRDHYRAEANRLKRERQRED